MDKEKEREKYVKEQRKKFFSDPIKFIIEDMIKPTWRFWKEEPLYALSIFIKWVLIYYLLFGVIQAINNDMIYCDASIDQFDGKLMYVHNDFVKYYNDKASELEKNYIPYDLNDAKNNVDLFNNDYTMYCDYNLSRWRSEPEKERLNTIWYGFKKIILKKS